MGRITMKLDRGTISDVARELDAIGELETRAPAALRAGANVLLPAAIAAAPVRSGRMKGTVGIRERGYGSGKAVEVGAINSPVAHLVEAGHGGPKPAPPHPWLAPAAESVEDQVVEAIAEALLGGF